MVDERIQILKEILLDLHHGASPDSVQERFNATFAGVSAIEISLMEHELMNSDSGVTFEDVMSLCNVHANLFKGAIQDVEVADVDHPGHPVRIFKDENLALRATLLRIRRILEQLVHVDEEELKNEMQAGLKRQMSLLAQFERHYQRKEELFFPIMERYGHDAPPKVMWGVDDQIRDLFAAAMKELGDSLAFQQAFETFAAEFEAMIFKEESILLLILLEAFTQDDWLQIAAESDAYGYAIVKPSEKWQPHRERFATPETSQTSATLADGQVQQRFETPEGEFTITFTPKADRSFDRQTPQDFSNGYLSVEEANLILNHLPMEITFVNKDDIFQYYNEHVSADEMIFKRTPSQIGRHVELCHPPKLLPKVQAIFSALREGKKDKFEMWFNSESRGKFVHVTYAAVRDDKGEFQGVLEYVQDIKPYRDIDSDAFRGLE